MKDEHIKEIIMLSDFLAKTFLKYRKYPLFKKSIDEAIDFAFTVHGDYIGENVDDFVQSVFLSASFHNLAKSYCDSWYEKSAESEETGEQHDDSAEEGD